MALGLSPLGRDPLGGGASVIATTTVTVGQATETDSALSVTVKVGIVVAVGQAPETDSALAATTKTGVLVVVGQATETDTALAANVAVFTPITVTVGQAEETDSALGVTVSAQVVVGQATETSSALGATVSTTVMVGQATETDVAFAASALTVVHVGQATETDVAFAVNVDNPLGTFVVHVGQATEIDGALSVEISVGYTDTVTTNTAYAVMFTGDADVTWEPAVVTRPLLLVNGGSQIEARQVPAYTLTDEGAAIYADQADLKPVSIPRHRDRILIGNQDWTFRHGLPLEIPDFELLDPFMYGDGGTLILPSINARKERLGHGRLKHVKLGAKVVYQRVDEDTDEVVETDYKGLVLRQGRNGDQLSLAVGGELLGRAAMKWHDVPIFRKVVDAGTQLFNSVVGLGLRYTPRLGHVGIKLASRGGMWEDQYLLDTQAQLVTSDGDQWTIMPTASGAYTHQLKDLDTIHATVYFDNEFAVEDLGEDLAEKPNRVWINAVGPDGQRIMHASAPNLQATSSPTRPLAFDPEGDPEDTFAMHLGTLDENTTTGDGVTVLVWRLTFTGLLDRADLPGGFDQDVADAVKAFQFSAGCANLTGSVDAETWDKLWDNYETGYSIAFASQRPAAEDDSVKKFDRDGSGNITGLHDGYDPTVPIVDLPLDMGPIANRSQGFRMARHKLHRRGDVDWVGTITLTSGLIEGEHNPGDALTADRVIPNRAVRPGWNVWEPHFDGGTLFHVVGCRVSDKGRIVELIVDTRARPAQEAWDVHRRNRENKYQPSRYLGGHRRRSTAVQDTVTPWDKIVGQTDRDWDLVPGWNRIPVPSGQAGTVSRTDIVLDRPQEFAAAVSTLPIPIARMNRLIQPLVAPPSDPQRHRIEISGRAHGGTFTLANDAEDETSTLAYNATAGAVQSAVRGLGGGFSDARVSGPAGGPWVVTMSGEADLDVGSNDLTGGNPSISVTSSGPSEGEGTPWYGLARIRLWLKKYGVPVAWGTFDNPCGYGDWMKTNPKTGEETGAAVTGEFGDDDGFGYDCGVFGAVLYLYIYVPSPNVLPRQRIFHQQLDGSGV